jgi:ABC-type lipoprotein release transport system permease subunit
MVLQVVASNVDGAPMLKILLILSVRSLRTHKITTFIVGSIIFFGTWMMIFGTALVDSLERSLEKTVISSVTGHLQVYSSKARDDLAMFGSGFIAVDDVGEMPVFGRVKSTLLTDANVEAVVPMGIQFHALVQGNELDRVVEDLTTAVRQGDTAKVDALALQVQDMAGELERELSTRMVIAAEDRHLRTNLAAVRKVRSAAFWQELRANPEPALEFLDTQIAPLGGTGPTIYLRDLGTDLQAFTRNFDRFELVDGGPVPEGHRGFLLSKFIYEKQLKHPVARTFDELATALADPDRHIEGDPFLKELAERLPQQYQRITFQLSPEQGQALRARLRAFLPGVAGEFPALLKQFLTVDDSNFHNRHQFFYETIAPMIHLYAVRLGDVITLQGMTKGGYSKSVKVRVYGTFQFRGLDKSAFAGAQNLMDLVTFRELYGARNTAEEQELAALRRSVAVEDIDREQAEAQLFTDTTSVRARRAEERAQDNAVHVPADLKGHPKARADTFKPADVEEGIALNAAVMLKDARDIEGTRQRLQTLVDGAGLGLHIVDWQAASGMVSRFVLVVHLFLYVATGVIFLVALVIMSNAMTMATAERAREIGTIRAIGGQRGFVMVMYLFETLTLGLIAGSLGGLAGLATVAAMAHKGIPAASDIMIFLFSGPRFYPQLHLANVLFGILAVLLMSLVSTLYPARVATRIQPVVAMQAKE